MLTVRGMVATAQAEIRDTPDLGPERARVLLGHLSGLIGNCNDEIRTADLVYAKALCICFETYEAANRAKVVAECMPEYARKREARDTKELVIELIRSLKYILRSFEEEMRLGGH